MKYVFVSGRPTNGNQIDYLFNSINQSENILISLIDTLNSSNFQINSFFNNISSMRERYRLLNYNTFIDSGGYSIIVGDVKAENISEFIDRYVLSIQTGKNVYDVVFSLDIPIFLKQEKYNTRESIKQFNRESLAKTFYTAYENPEIMNKLYFVWQFKMLDQYEVWDELYTELNLNQYVKNRALGGMVGLRGITQINFSPFIGMAYRCLLDYIDGDTSVPFKLHCLGIYIQHDRFFLILLEKLFNYYLNCQNCHITYDSINYMRTAQLRVKDLPIYTFRSKQKIETFQHLETPDDVLQIVYLNNTFDAIKIEIERVKSNQNVNNIDAFTPLNIYSNLQLDLFFEHIIDKYNLLNYLITNPVKIRACLEQIAAAHSNVFTPARIRSLRSNFNKLLKFHFWFTKNRTREEFKTIIYDFIKDIQFPANLSDIHIEQVIDPYSGWNKLSELS